MDRLLDPGMHIIVDELADYHSLLLGSYKEKQTKTCCLFLQSMSLPVFPTGAIVAAYSERQDMISLVPDLLLGWGGITDPYFMKHALRV